MMESGIDFRGNFSPITMNQDDDNVHTDTSAAPVEDSVGDAKTLVTKSGKSGIWKHFCPYKEPEYRHLAHCLLCMQDVNYTLTKSTGMLQHHLKRKHQTEHDIEEV